MKKLILTTLIFVCVASLFAQETEVIYSEKEDKRPMNTLFGDDKGFGGHLSLNARGAEFYDETALFLGGELVFTLSHALNLGVAGYGMPTRIEYQDTQNDYLADLNLEFGYGGLFVEPVFFDQQVVHFTVPVLIGAGWAALSDDSFLNNPGGVNNFRIYQESVFFVFEPGINLEVNLVRHIKLAFGGSYRLVNGSDLNQIADSDLSGFSFGGGIRVGWF